MRLDTISKSENVTLERDHHPTKEQKKALGPQCAICTICS